MAAPNNVEQSKKIYIYIKVSFYFISAHIETLQERCSFQVFYAGVLNGGDWASPV